MTQLQHEGYSIFIVDGDLPPCEADAILANTRVTQVKKPVSSRTSKKSAVRLVEAATIGSDGFTDEERQQFKESIESSQRSRQEEEKRQLEVALSLSLSQEASQSTAVEPIPSSSLSRTALTTQTDFMTDEELQQLEEAMKMSLES